jgi:hypothetical protein
LKALRRSEIFDQDPFLKGRLTMRLALVGATAATVALFAAASPASATIHPIVASAECANAPIEVADPPGQTPGENHSDQSTLRALQSTGVLTDAGLDLTQPASKYTTFDPATETGTSDHPGLVNCQGG